MALVRSAHKASVELSIGLLLAAGLWRDETTGGVLAREDGVKGGRVVVATLWPASA